MSGEPTPRPGGATGTGTKGTVKVGRRVVLPTGAQRPYRVYINGVEQTPGTDYRVDGREIIFSRAIIKEGKLGTLRWLSMVLGLFGTYRTNEVIDIEYHRDGRPQLLPDVAVIPDPPGTYDDAAGQRR